MACHDRCLCQKSVGKTLILSRSGGWICNLTDGNRHAGSPVAGMEVQVFIHSSYLCQIGEANQGPLAPQNDRPLFGG